MPLIDFLNKLLGDPNEKELKKIRPLIPSIRERENSAEFQRLTLGDLPNKTEEFKARIEKGESLDDLLPEAFALVARACSLLVGEKYNEGNLEFEWNIKAPFDVQLVGGIALHRGVLQKCAPVKERRLCVPCRCT